MAETESRSQLSTSTAKNRTRKAATSRAPNKKVAANAEVLAMPAAQKPTKTVTAKTSKAPVTRAPKSQDASSAKLVSDMSAGQSRPLTSPTKSDHRKSTTTSQTRKRLAAAAANLAREVKSVHPSPEPVKEKAQKTEQNVELISDEQAQNLANLVAELDELRLRLADTEQLVTAASQTITKDDMLALKQGRKLYALTGWRRRFVNWLVGS